MHPSRSDIAPASWAPRLAAVVALGTAATEILLLSLVFDSAASSHASNSALLEFAIVHLGDVAKIGVLAAVTAALLVGTRIPAYLERLYGAIEVRRFLTYYGANIFAYAFLFLVTSSVFVSAARSEDPTPASALELLAWLALGIATLGLLAMSLVTIRAMSRFAVAELPRLGVAIAVAVCVWLAAESFQGLWSSFSDATFWLSAKVLQLLTTAPVIVDHDSKLLGLGEFVVSVAPACSGYEGIGLVTAFTAIHLFVFRGDIRFPRAYLLFPIGACTIWLLNSVRIAALVAIGHHWSADVAVGGFHSQAGWMTFILTSLLIVWLAGRSRAFRKPEATIVGTEMNVSVATLVPITVLLGVALVASAFTAEFDWPYPLRVCAVAIALYAVRRQLAVLTQRPSWQSVLAGAVVAAVWLLWAGANQVQSDAFSAHLGSVSPWLASAWLLFRFAGFVVTVPIAEELAFRGYLLCKLSKVPVALSGKLPVSVPAVLLSSLAFGALHGDWVVGTFAGLVYAAVRLRGASVTDAIVAHATSNLLIFAFAASTASWSVM